MNNDSESAVIDSAGTPRRFIYRPVLLLAGLLCIISFVTDNFVEPESRLGMRRTIAATYADLLSTVIEEKAFRRIDDGLYVQISERVKGRVLRGLFVADSRDPHFEMLYYAREGAVDEKGGTLIMKDGEIHRKAPGGNVSIIHFDSYSFDLSDLSETRGQAKLHASDRGLGFLFDPDPKDPDFMDKPLDYRAELHRRLTDWFFPVIFSLASLALAGGAHSHRERAMNPLVPALVFAFAFRWSAFFLANRIESPRGSPVPLYAFVVVVTLLLLYAIYRNSRHLRKGRPLDGLTNGIMRAASRLRGPRPSNAGASE